MKNKIEKRDKEIACHQQQPRGSIINRTKEKKTTIFFTEVILNHNCALQCSTPKQKIYYIMHAVPTVTLLFEKI
jgi:hypothetical protein